MERTGHSTRVWGVLAFIAVASSILSLGRVHGVDNLPSCTNSSNSSGVCSNGTLVCDVESDCGGVCLNSTNGRPCGTFNFNRCTNVTCFKDACVNDSQIDFGAFSGECAVGSNANQSVCDIAACSDGCGPDGQPCATTDANLCTTGLCQGGGCVPEFTVPASCDDDNFCTQEGCDPAAELGQGGCTHDRIVNCTDDDGDGVASTTEDAVPSASGSPIQPTGDGNGDGILDSLEHNVTSLPSATGRGYITLISTCDQNLNVKTFTEEQLGSDPEFDAPFGYIGFKTCNGGVNCTAATCSAADIRVIFHGTTTLPDFVYRKFGPTTPGNGATTKFYTLDGVVFSGNEASFTLTDGALGDDLGVDGMILDPSAPARAVTQSAPTLNSWALAATVLVLTGVALVGLRQRSHVRSRTGQ